MGKKPPQWLPGERVQETILTQRKSVEQLRADRVLRKKPLREQRERMKEKIDSKRKKRLGTKKFLPASAILKQALRTERQTKGFHKRGEKFASRRGRKTPEKVATQYQNAPVALVVRTSGKQIPREASTAFRKLGLDKMYKARLIHLNPHNDKLTKQLKTFTTVGFPTKAELEDLVRTRASFWNPETKSKAYISGNLQVEQTLGEYNVLSIEELVDAIVNKSEHLDQILRRLAAFDFHPPRKLHVEHKRSAHEKLEIANPQAFGKFLSAQLAASSRARSRAKKDAFAKSKKTRGKPAAAAAAPAVAAKADKKAATVPKRTAAAPAPAAVVKKAPAKAAKKAVKQKK